MSKVNSQSVDKYGADNMRGNAVRNIGRPKQKNDALTWSIPDYTTAERDDIIVETDTRFLIFNSTTNKLNFYDGGAWRVITST